MPVNMAPNSEILRFKFTSYGDSMLQKMNVLRQQNRFCDVTIKINNVAFVGHKIILAACSPFLRDQFLLNESKEVRISLLQSSEVGEQILRSCYTGALEFPVKELVNYLTAASYLQMGHIVERCTEALTKYIEPKLLSDDLGQASCCAEQSQDVPSPNSERNQLGDLSPSGDVSDCDTDSEDSNIRIVKVESLTSDVQEAESGTLRQLRAELGRASERRVASPPEPQHSLVNSTVDSRGHKAGSCLQSYGGSRPRVSEVVNGTSFMLAANEFELQGLSSFPSEDLTGAGGFLFRRNRGTKLFANKALYTSHYKAQDKWLQKPHQCSKCGKIFHHLENFISHLKTHKLFLCLRCGKIFTQKSNLTRHIRVHTGIKPYQCTICGKTFTQKCSLQDHLNLHSGDRPHKCNYCDVGFAHKPALRRHLKEQHGKKCVDNVTEGSIQEISLEVNTID
ncbi:zinc finger and BTB domain-containing protein 26 [Callorhinchus milii]|uniref:zinc finger and BTB domain-containing protein 26 n=1 Tax=Callorhinchus milii TaxID=7868 RepID=UPI0004576357|nr:zinc finger and BTB domain-containing protein 26 [Callorhinchus milii]|eukprot:gi/632988700/ref/XP_007883254.1/ PREDICTED: zinc finger and BTB domain-containing protein 26-like [Callorhinchus milii]